MTEVRKTSKTGGQKGSKPQQPALIPSDILLELSEVYAIGAEKYDDHNWRKGYEWQLSINAAMRHLMLFNAGEDYDICKCEKQNDPPAYPCKGCGATGKKHILMCAWHCMSLAWYMNNKPEFDDRAARFDEKQAIVKTPKFDDPVLMTTWEDLYVEGSCEDQYELNQEWHRDHTWKSLTHGLIYRYNRDDANWASWDAGDQCWVDSIFEYPIREMGPFRVFTGELP
ncbi:hypothetical protein EniyanLRS_86 [Mycobacterium phage EniyanLRS]|uniref:dATP/dGTP diphosphohydrolase N-terminal domain-containing protein n=1 Tax=Mycobacterium phage EniyanLRS TaxID=1933770 RepID=A0A2I2MPI4_9CAUD|nr:hypothetical protein EniyanLRS_86 [Mycobacterium phage EniyanLRS]